MCVCVVEIGEDLCKMSSGNLQIAVQHVLLMRALDNLLFKIQFIC